MTFSFVIMTVSFIFTVFYFLITWYGGQPTNNSFIIFMIISNINATIYYIIRYYDIAILNGRCCGVGDRQHFILDSLF